MQAAESCLPLKTERTEIRTLSEMELAINFRSGK
jgi:hypothetical protein